MANDLGDNHALSLKQGGALPASSTNFRTAGKIFAEAGKPVTYILYPEQPTRSLFVGLYNSAGTQLSAVSGTGTITGNFTPTTTGWITIRVRNNVASNPAQKCWVNVTYTAPAVVTNAMGTPALNTSSVWSGNGGNSDWYNPDNWEEAMVPQKDAHVHIPGGVFPQPALLDGAELSELTIEEGAHVFVHGKLEVQTLLNTGEISGQGSLKVGDEEEQMLRDKTMADFDVVPNPINESWSLVVNGYVDAAEKVQVRILSSDGKLVLQSAGTLAQVNEQMRQAMEIQTPGMYFLSVFANGGQSTIKLVK
jgi:hypothetical protein